MAKEVFVIDSPSTDKTADICAEFQNVDKVTIGSNTIVSPGAYLCTASHDVTSPLIPLITAPIILEDQAWVIGASTLIHPPFQPLYGDEDLKPT